MSQAVARSRAGQTGTGGDAVIVPRALSPVEKAAVIVRLLLSEGADLPLSSLPEHMQAALAEQIGQMRLVDRVTLAAVVEEFLGELEQVGLSFPGGLEGALSMMGGHISASAANRLRRLAAASAKTDPWDRILPQPPEALLPVLEQESIEVGAVLLSKLPVPKAADLLGRLPGERARRVAHAMALTANVDPDTVRRIGHALAAQLDATPARAFEAGPVERVGAILNISPAATREDVLAGLQAADAGFAEQVRRAIFTFLHIPRRVLPRDVPKILRVVDQPVIVTALAATAGRPEGEAVAEFLLGNMSQRMAQGLREEMAARGRVKEKDAEEAMNAVVMAIRQLESAGELVLISEDDD
jgi:flagellar motor switch protein FliG